MLSTRTCTASYIVNAAAHQSTQSIFEKLQGIVHDKYLNDYQHYLHAVAAKKIKAFNPNRSKEDGEQPTITSVFRSRKADENAAERKTRLLQNELTQLRRKLRDATAAFNGDICLHDLNDKKKGRNRRSLEIPGLGTGKISKLKGANVNTAKQLLAWAGDPAICSHTVLSRWKKWTQQALAKYKARVDDLSALVKIKSDNYDFECFLCDVDKDENPLADSLTPLAETTTRTPPPDPPTVLKPAMLSKFDDQNGYNGLVLSKYRIDSIVMTEFFHRKGLQDAKMRGIHAEILKLDFNYKIAGKVRVWTGRGRSFAPFKSIGTDPTQKNRRYRSTSDT